MTDEAGLFLYLAAAIAVGFTWGKVSSRLPIPELLRLLGTFVCTGVLGVLFGLGFGLVQVTIKTPRVEEWLSLPLFVLVEEALTYGGFCFLAGAVFGLPAILGFAFGYRKPRAE